MIRFLGGGWRFGADPGGWEWTTSRLNVRGFIPDGWNTSIALVRRPPRTSTRPPVDFFDQYLVSVRARNLACFLLAVPCALLPLHLRQGRRRGFPVSAQVLKPE